MDQLGLDYRKCSVRYCNNAHYAKGLCTQHYANMRRNGTIVPRGDTVAIMAIAMQILKTNVPAGDYNRAVGEAWEAAQDDVPALAAEFEQLIVEDVPNE